MPGLGLTRCVLCSLDSPELPPFSKAFDSAQHITMTRFFNPIWKLQRYSILVFR
jgi:hypothetical protein